VDRREGATAIYLLHPLTDAAHEWVRERLPDDAQRWCGAVVVEHRYIEDIARGIVADGLTVE
jgi:hypothetical protein